MISTIKANLYLKYKFKLMHGAMLAGLSSCYNLNISRNAMQCNSCLGRYCNAMQYLPSYAIQNIKGHSNASCIYTCTLHGIIYNCQ